jgi:glycosyltransferase involved in cell wall biosynthesis
MIILTAFYNVENYIERCINSIKDQTFTDFKCYLIDDVSTDSTVYKIKPLIENDKRFILIENKDKKYKTKNFVDVLSDNNIDDEDIVIELDGDDYFFDNKVLEKVDNVYQNKNVWITNGSFVYSSGMFGFSSEQKNFNTLRQQRFTASHLRTWKVFLWRNIEDKDHRDSEGNYFKLNADLAYMLPMLEMAGEKNYKFIPNFMVVYNEQNPLNDHKLNMSLVDSCANEIRSRKKYNKLIW